MRGVAIWAAVLCVVAAGPTAAIACSMPRRTAPLVYERFTEGGRYVVAMVEPPDDYVASFNYQPSDDVRRILATYPQSGVYRTDDLSVAILDIPEELEESEIVGFFEQRESVYLITGPGGDLKFFRDGDLVRSLGYESLEWITAPWFYQITCGGGSIVDARLDDSGARPRVVVETPERAQFHYDALTGRLVQVDRPEFASTDTATASERALAAILARLLRQYQSSGFEDLGDGWRESFETAWIEDCMMVERSWKLDWETHETQAGDTSELEDDPRFRALRIDVHGGRRLRHGREPEVDLYRVEPNKGSEFLCGGNVLDGDWLGDSVRRELGPDESEAAFERLRQGFQGETVAAATTWDVGEDEDWEDVSRLGVITLWSRASGEWRILMLHRFAVPKIPELD